MLTPALYISDCNTSDNATSDVSNTGYYKDENPTSPLVLKSLRANIVPEEGAECTSLDQNLVICKSIACATMNPVSHEVNVDTSAKILAFRSCQIQYTVTAKPSLREKLTKLLPCQVIVAYRIHSSKLFVILGMSHLSQPFHHNAFV